MTKLSKVLCVLFGFGCSWIMEALCGVNWIWPSIVAMVYFMLGSFVMGYELTCKKLLTTGEKSAILNSTVEEPKF